jgi:hypothetical protein
MGREAARQMHAVDSWGGKMSANMPAHLEKCEVDCDAMNRGAMAVVSLTSGTRQWSATPLRRSPEAILAILLRYGWIVGGKRTVPNTSRYYWRLSRTSITGRALDDALSELQQL